MSDASPSTTTTTTAAAALTADALRAVVLDGLMHIAPEIDRAALRGDLALRDQVDLDSMDFLNFVIGLSESLGVAVPEVDYPQLATLDGCVGYLLAHGARTP